MDLVFLLEEEGCTTFLRTVGQTLGCTYICLWFYHPPPSNCIPGLALKGGLVYLELHDSEILNLALIELQQQFYQEASIKTVVLMACGSGEIELGWSTSNHFNMELEMVNLFTEILQQSQFGEPCIPDQSRPSSSSSSMRSPLVGSPDYSSLFVNLASTSYKPQPIMETFYDQATRPKSTVIPFCGQAYSRDLNVQFPPLGRDEEAMTRAMLSVLSSHSSSSSSSSISQTQQIQTYRDQVSDSGEAFKPYVSALRPMKEMKPNSSGQNMIKRAFTILGRIHMERMGTQVQETLLTGNRLHHVVLERKRREKLNELFEKIRLLLPPGTKKDKASVLSSAIEHLSSLEAQIFKMMEKKRSLEARLLPEERAYEEVGVTNERVELRFVEASESSSEERQIDLQIVVRESVCDTTDLVIRVLEYLKHMDNVSLVSIEADTQLQQTNQLNRAATSRLRVKPKETYTLAFF
ncbi:putative transcription factor bHLH041 [Tasmannia lanceolata]|uniref:putative transcription factor bHLH041 n=1 Tax=Tasmannia lanceolata TaxID=3420 RepID=UPI004064B56B